MSKAVDLTRVKPYADHLDDARGCVTNEITESLRLQFETCPRPLGPTRIRRHEDARRWLLVAP